MLKDNVPILMLGWMVVWSVGTTLVQWLLARGRATKAEISALSAKLDGKADCEEWRRHETKLIELDRRAQKLEHEVGALPTLSLFHQLALDLKEFGGRLGTIEAALKTNTEMTRRIDDYLMERK